MTLHPEDLIGCVTLAIAAAAIAMSFSQGSMFEPLRKSIAARSKLLGELASCFFCLSHWVAIAGVAIYRPQPLRAWWPADFLIAVFVVVAIATIIAGLMFAAFLAAISTHHLRERVASKRP
jgi:hypothetical protein